MSEADYPLESSEHERQRLMRQADMMAESTERLFRKAGIGPGMRVLDVGSGAGDVAFLARRLVGDTGEVIGTDRDEEQVAVAGHRARSLGYANVSFIASDYRSLVLDTAVDAIVGRLVLVFSRDPVASLVDVCGNLRHGGLVAFQESIMQYDAPVLVEPRDGLAGKVVHWITAGLAHSGLQPRLGLKLFGIMGAAGLEPSPDIEATIIVRQGPKGSLFPDLADFVRSAMPSIVASGVATEAEIDIDTLEQRLVHDAAATGVVGTIAPGFIGVWARKP